MSKSRILTIEVPYYDRENKSVGRKSFKIERVFNYISRDYQKIIDIATEAQKKLDAIKAINNEVYEMIKDPPDNWRDIKKEQEAKLENLTAELEGFNESNYFKMRVELIKNILTDNGVEDKEVHTFEFWDTQVEPHIIMDFITKCVTKDNPIGTAENTVVAGGGKKIKIPEKK